MKTFVGASFAILLGLLAIEMVRYLWDKKLKRHVKW